MILTWKKWATLCVIAILAFLACQFYSELKLRDFYYAPNRQSCGDGVSESHMDYRQFRNLVRNMESLTHLPWPIRLGLDEKVRPFDPAQPQTRDPETIMGLALLGPAAKDEICEAGCSHRHDHQMNGRREWFKKLSGLAVSLAKDPDEKQKLEQVKLFVESNATIFANDVRIPQATQPASATTSQEVRFGDAIVTQARQIDPKNLVYACFEAYPDLLAVTAESGRMTDAVQTLPGKTLDQYYTLKNDEGLIAAARAINENLNAVPAGSKFITYRSYQRALKEKGLIYRYGKLDPLCLLSQSDLGFASLFSHVDSVRDSVRRLCFVGNKLAERGENELALDMYRHAYKLGEQLMVGEGKETAYLQFVMGRNATTFVSENLMAFWAGKGQAEKTMRAKMLLDENQLLVKREIEQEQKKGSDPLGHHEAGYENYARAAGLTWWFGTTGLVFAVMSLISVALYILLMRKRYLGEGVLQISYKLLEMGLGVPIFLMVWLAMITPLDLENYYGTGSLLTWGWAMILLWLIFIGLLAQFSGSEPEGIRRSPGRRIWIFTSLGVAAACIVASIISAEMLEVIAVGIGAFVIGVGFFIWLVVVMICWVVRRSHDDLSSRARANLAFAVCSMLACAVFLIAALLSMPLAKHQQDLYYAQAISDTMNETGYYAGENWPVTFKPLPAEMFEIGK